MSTIKAINIQHPSASSPNIVLSSTGNVTGTGLDLINKTDFSASSTINVNNCFSSAYRAYRIVLANVAPSTGLSVYFKYRSSGSDITGPYYQGCTKTTQVATGTYLGNSASSVYLASSNSSADAHMLITIDLGYPSPSGNYKGMTISSAGAGGGYAEFIYGGCVTTASGVFDGFSLSTSTGTITGTVCVYGYRSVG